MVQIAALLLAFPIGLGRWNLRTALILVTVLLVVLLVPQTISVNDMPDENIGVAYWAIQAITFAVAYGLTYWGHRWMQNRRTAAAS